MPKTGECAYALEITDVSKRFDQNWVLKRVNLKVRRGSIHAIVGHNGAGKSTLMKIALGAERPTEGSVHIGGRRLTYSGPAEARTLGLGMVMQNRSLIGTMTGIDNIFLNSERLNAFGCIDLRRERAEINGLIEQLGIKPSTLSLRVSDLSTIEQELIEIGKALRLGDQVLVLDEPTAPLGQDEIRKLFDVLRAIAARGTGVVFITHHLAEVFEVSDEVTCLREGNVVLSRSTKEVEIADLISAMLGKRSWVAPAANGRVAAYRGGSALSAPADRHDMTPALTARNLSIGTRLRDVSFDAFAGQIVGIVGLAGSGRTNLLRALFGDLRASGGELRLFGNSYQPRSPADAIAHGVFLVPQDRGLHGLLLSKSIAENIILVILGQLRRKLGLLKLRDGRQRAQQMMKVLDIRAKRVHQIVGQLSGGNQQKVVLAKALALRPRVLLLDEPTAGVDIATAHQIMAQVRTLAAAGSTVLWVSSDLLEITRVSDRIAILRDGTICTTIARDDSETFNEHFISAMMQRSYLH